MPIPAIVGAAIIGAAGSAGGAALAARGQSRAARYQADAQRRADQIQEDANRRAEQIQREQMDYDRWLQSATSAARQPYLDQAAGIDIGGLPGAFGEAEPFTAPTREEAMNDPAYQFAVEQGNKGIEQSAAARGTLLTGGTLKDLQNFGQQAATNQYDKVYGRAMNAYQLREMLRGQAYERNLDAARVGQSASLGRINALLSMAGMATPGQYPGYSGPKEPAPSPPSATPRWRGFGGGFPRRTGGADPTQQPRRSFPYPQTDEDSLYAFTG